MPPTTEKPTEKPTEETTSEPAAQIPSCIKKDGKVRSSFEKNNWKIIITTKDIAKEIVPYLGYDAIMGLTVTNKKTIYIED